MSMYEQKEGHYFSNTRNDLISFLPNGGVKRLLEIGAGSGDTLVEIKKRNLAEEVIGFELMKLQGSNQENALIDQFIIGDFESTYAQFSLGFFDAIICGDVLEHLVNPWQVVEKLSSMLSPGGLLIVSTPNVRYYEMFMKVFLKGTFQYTDHGLFDKTHLRFFCKKDLQQMLTEPGLKVKSTTPSLFFFRRSKYFLLNKITFGLLEEFLALQYIVCAERPLN